MSILPLLDVAMDFLARNTAEINTSFLETTRPSHYHCRIPDARTVIAPRLRLQPMETGYVVQVLRNTWLVWMSEWNSTRYGVGHACIPESDRYEP